MSGCTHHDTPKKNRFIGAVQAGKPLTKAAADLDTTASNLWVKFNDMGSTHARP
jgi:hypothetical protein